MSFAIVNTEATWGPAIALERRDPANVCEAAGRWFQTYIRRGRVRFHQRPNPQTGWAAEFTVTQIAGWSDLSIAAMPSGQVVIAAHWISGKQSRVHSSYDDGETWAEVTEMPVGMADIAQDHGILYAAGVDLATGIAYWLFSEDEGATWSAPVEIAASNLVQPAIEFLPTAEIVVSLAVGNAMADYVSRDYGQHWSAC